MLKNAGLKHILLVTSGAHMRRSLALFEKQGLQVTAAATDHQIPQFADPYLTRLGTHLLAPCALHPCHTRVGWLLGLRQLR